MILCSQKRLDKFCAGFFFKHQSSNKISCLHGKILETPEIFWFRNSYTSAPSFAYFSPSGSTCQVSKSYVYVQTYLSLDLLRIGGVHHFTVVFSLAEQKPSTAKLFKLEQCVYQGVGCLWTGAKRRFYFISL